jgi:uncharacterized membrane protein YhiD involved in acid resistance
MYMGKLETFEAFLVGQSPQIDYSYLVLALVISAILTYILKKVYIKYGTSLSNRKLFSNNFMLLTITTTLIIMVIKSSLALSLGLVGALSIIRFRAAIKEPEELAYLFLTISIGLGLGAGQLMVTLISFAIIVSLICLRGIILKKKENRDLSLIISGKGIKLEKVVEILKKNCSNVYIKRFDQTEEDFLEACFLVDIKNFKKLEEIKEALKKLSKKINITYLEKSLI